MFFHSWPFLVFFAVVYGGYLLLRRTNLCLPWLLLASYVFYGWWNPLYLLLVFYSTLVDYVCVNRMALSDRRGMWLTVSLVNNLSLLGFFKYANFAADNFNGLLAFSGAGFRWELPEILLPVGISFFTFQSMSYTIDFYRGEIEREPSFIRFATFVSFFPQLVAGPIERASSLLPQLRTVRRITRQHVADGGALFLTGLFKKVALANYLAAYADPVFANPSSRDASTLLLAVFAFAWQIYFDFSGYTDMARGVARGMGYDLMLNFHHPYLASSLNEFWRRWHISLSSWFRDYVYIPLGGSRSGTWRLYRNLLLTMVISGVWHGAAWTFVLWGAAHGIAFALLRPLERSVWYRHRVPRAVKVIGVFLFVCATWILFRAESVHDVTVIVRTISAGAFHDPAFPLLALGLVGSVWAYQVFYDWAHLTGRDAQQLVPGWAKVMLYVAMLVYLSFAPGAADQPFIYFQF